MDIFKYKDGVKSFQSSSIVAELLAVQVAANDLISNLDRMKSNDLDLSSQIESWVITKSLKKQLAGRNSSNYPLPSLLKMAADVVVILSEELGPLVKVYNEKIWDGKLLSLRQVSILNMIDHLQFWNNYTSMLMTVLLTMHNKQGGVDKASISKFDLDWINGTLSMYTELTISLLNGSRRIVTELKSIPDANVDETSLAVLESTDDVVAGVIKKGFGIHQINPVFWGGLIWSKIHLARIEKMRAANDIFAMKISQAVNLKNGQEDPQLDNRIEILENKIIKNEDAIRSIEAQYA